MNGRLYVGAALPPLQKSDSEDGRLYVEAALPRTPYIQRVTGVAIIA